MKYKVTHTVLSATLPADKDNPHGTSKTFKLDQHVTPEELKDAGFDVDFLLKNGSIGKLEGQDYDDTVNAKPAGDVAKSSNGDGKSEDTASAAATARVAPTAARATDNGHAAHAKK